MYLPYISLIRHPFLIAEMCVFSHKFPSPQPLVHFCFDGEVANYWQQQASTWLSFIHSFNLSLSLSLGHIMITSLSWIPRGAARQRPVRYELTPEEYQRVRSLAKKEAGEQDDTDAMKRTDVAIEEEDSDENVDISELPDELHMEDYDDEELGGLVKNDDEDDLFDFQQQGNNVILDEGDSDEEDAEDNEVRPTDALLAVAITEDEYSHLEIQLLSDDGNLYVHHDIALPDFPLCLAWTDCPPFLAQDNQSQVTIGNFMAVGTFNPVIEIWNLDVLDPLEPTATLGKLKEIYSWVVASVLFCVV